MHAMLSYTVFTRLSTALEWAPPYNEWNIFKKYLLGKATPMSAALIIFRCMINRHTVKIDRL